MLSATAEVGGTCGENMVCVLKLDLFCSYVDDGVCSVNKYIKQFAGQWMGWFIRNLVWVVYLYI